MRVIIASSMVPFVFGGGRFIVDWLETRLRERGHEVEKFYLPFNEHHPHVLDGLLAYRLMDLGENADRLIAIRPPSHVLRHPAKVVWFIHHLRGYYDLAGTEHASAPDTGAGRALVDALHRHDTMALNEARRVFTNSGTVRDRLQRYNGVAAQVLYPPLLDTGLYRDGEANDEIVSVCRIEPHKRQDLLVRAMSHVKTAVRLRLCGVGINSDYVDEIRTLVDERGLADKVTIEETWISEERKAELVSHALASVYAPLDEDSYGYPTLEAAAAARPTVTTLDAGGTLEFIRHGENGLVAEPTPQALAAAFDALFLDRERTARLGRAARATIGELNITWDHVVERLLA